MDGEGKSDDPANYSLLDGRNRLDAMELATSINNFWRARTRSGSRNQVCALPRSQPQGVLVRQDQHDRRLSNEEVSVGEMTELEGIVLSFLNNTKKLADWGMEKGEITTSFRLTIPERKRQAKMLVASGMSTREAAEALGVSHTTVERDLAGTNGAKNGTKCSSSPTETEEPPIGGSSPEGEPDDDVPDQLTVRERFLRVTIADNLIGLSQLPKKYRAILFDQQIEKYGAEMRERLAIREENHGNNA
jgi:hypothetical protein